MTAQLTTTQLNAINHMSAEQRYDYFISKSVGLQEVWGLSSEQGWVILPEAGDEHFPVWPHQELAAAWATGEFADCEPKRISLDDWLNKWLPGMEKDSLLAAVCPDAEGDSIIVAAEELLEDTQAALGK